MLTFHFTYTARSITAAIAAAAFAPTASAQEIGRIVVFGDSLADGGYFAALGFAPSTAGSFTTNPDAVAPEVFARGLGLFTDTAYPDGYSFGSLPTGEIDADNDGAVDGDIPNNGFNYAIGGARIDKFNPLVGFAIPIATQIDLFQAAGRNFSDSDAVYIQGGGNDWFNFRAGLIDEAALVDSADTLAEQVERIEDLGAGTIVTANIPTRSADPLNQITAASLGIFNDAYEASLGSRNLTNVLFFDVDALYNEIVVDALENEGRFFGIVHAQPSGSGQPVRDLACGGLNSLQCTPDDLVEPDANLTYLFADTAHPAGRAQQIQGQAITATLLAPYQISQLAPAAEALFRGHRENGAVPTALNPLPGSDGAPFTVFGALGYDRYTGDDILIDTSVSQNVQTLSLGFNYAATDTINSGLYGALSTGNGHVGRGGDFELLAGSVTGYINGSVGDFRFDTRITGGVISYDDIVRRITLGAGTREQEGKTDGRYFGAQADVGYELFNLIGLDVGPEAGLTYSHIALDGFNDGPSSTGISYSDQSFNALTARIGIAAQGHIGEHLNIAARASYEHLFSADRDITITPNGAPVSFTRHFDKLDTGFLSYQVGVSANIRPNLSMDASVSGFAFREGTAAVTARLGASLTF